MNFKKLPGNILEKFKKFQNKKTETSRRCPVVRVPPSQVRSSAKNPGLIAPLGSNAKNPGSMFCYVYLQLHDL